MTVPSPTDLEAVSLLPTDDQRDLADVVRKFLDERSPEAEVRRHMETEMGLDVDAWRILAREIGICGLALPEELGGGGGTFADVAIVVEELGRSLACVPYFSTVVLSQTLLMALGGGEEWLPGLADGTTRGAVAFAEPGRTWDPAGITAVARQRAEGWYLSGTKTFVIDGHTADLLLVVALAAAGLSVFALPSSASGITLTPQPTMDLTRKQARLDLDGAPARLIGEAGGATTAFQRMLHVAAIALAIESVGGAQRVLDQAVDYARSRFQFGRAIGSFQAIKHRCADMLVAVESAKSAAYYARSIAARGDDDPLAAAAALAKSYCGDAYAMCAADNIQVHGGIGFTWEHSAHLYFKRATANRLMFGDPISHRERLGDLLGI